MTDDNEGGRKMRDGEEKEHVEREKKKKMNMSDKDKEERRNNEKKIGECKRK